jgi:hypothetical protein
MNIRRALTYLFDDPRWAIKLALVMAIAAPAALIASLGLLIDWTALHPALARFGTSPFWSILTSFLSVPVLGFGLRITRNVLRGDDVPLPSWDDVGGILRDGVKLWAVVTIWSLPVIFLTPISGMVLGPIITVVIAIFQPAAEARLAATGSLASSLDLTAVVGIVRRRLSLYLRLLGVSMGGTLAALALCFLLVLAVWRTAGGAPSVLELSAVATAVAFLTLWPYGQLVLYHLYGQVYARSA